MILVLFGRALQILLALATVRLATTLLTTVEMGKSALVLSTTAGFALLFVNPVGMFINRRLHAWKATGRLKQYFRIYWLYLVGVAAVSSICIAVASSLGILEFGVNLPWLLLLIGGSLLFSTLNQTYIPSLNMLGFPGWFVFLTLATQVTGLGIAVVLTLDIAPHAEYWLLGLLVGQALMTIVGKIIFEQHTPPAEEVGMPAVRLSPAYFRALYRFVWPLSLAVGFGWAQSQGYRFILEKSSGLSELGLFVAGYSISAGVIAAFESVLTTYFQPQFYARINTNDLAQRTEAWNAYASALFPTLLVTVLFVAGLSKELSVILLGPTFQAASGYVVWGAIAEAARVLAGAYSLVAHAQMKTRPLLLPSAVGAVLAVGLGLVLIPRVDGVGAGLSLAMSGLILVAVFNWKMRQQMAIKLPVRRLAFGAVFGSVIFVVAQTIQHSPLYSVSLLSAVWMLGLLGMMYMAIQYSLIIPTLRRI